MKKYLLQNGSGLLGIIVVVVIIAAVGLGSLFFYKKNSEEKKIKDNLQNAIESFETAKENIGEINKKVEEMSELVNEAVKEKEEEKTTEDWQTFKNERYGFSIKHPLGSSAWITAEDSSSVTLEDIDQIIISDNKKLAVHVKVKDPSFHKYIGASIKDILELDFEDYVKKIWELNSSKQSVKESGLSKINFKGNNAYTFSSSEGYRDEMGGSVLSIKKNYIFTEHKGLKYVFEFSDNEISKEVLETFEFTN